MAIRIVQLGTERAPSEGLRIGTVRRPPRGVPKNKFSSENWYDVWYPNLAPSDALLKLGQSVTTDREWARFAKKYAAEMKSPDTARTLALLAALSRQTDFSVGCYCDNEARCHRSVLRRLLLECGAAII